ncbi:hypothetical protein KQX54_021643 [Cotesia glomerata]|uniref:Uncharacterized protein n=2 Tax=Cotesia glomerata TaxID=32391 RepID=A0AAV7J776_COTGL|nr:hypothetical protein KQX54_021643 [Cotesia glomerata]
MKAASMGEYVINMGFDYMAHFCDAFKEPILLGPFYKAIGFDLDNCPPDVGVYVCENYHTPLDQLPQVFVPNNYNDIVELFCEEQKILTLHIFVKIV